MGAPRMTTPTRMVLELLLHDPARERYGGQIGEEAGLPSGTVHPILARLEACGWLESRWEDVDPRAVGRPARRFYRLTRDGSVAARDALARTAPRGRVLPGPVLGG